MAALLDVSPDLQPVYRDIHTAPEFGYALYPADGLTSLSSYIVVLDFIGTQQPFRLAANRVWIDMQCIVQINSELFQHA